MKSLFLKFLKLCVFLFIIVAIFSSSGLPVSVSYMDLEVDELNLLVIGKASYKLQGAQFIVPNSSDSANKKVVTL